jgi:hypothetical protein
MTTATLAPPSPAPTTRRCECVPAPEPPPVTTPRCSSSPAAVASAAPPSTKTTTTPPAVGGGASAAAVMIPVSTDAAAGCGRGLTAAVDGASVSGRAPAEEAVSRECTGAGRETFAELRCSESFASGVHDHSAWLTVTPDRQSEKFVRVESGSGRRRGPRQGHCQGKGFRPFLLMGSTECFCD